MSRTSRYRPKMVDGVFELLRDLKLQLRLSCYCACIREVGLEAIFVDQPSCVYANDAAIELLPGSAAFICTRCCPQLLDFPRVSPNLQISIDLCFTVN
ncbi:hypothetical protein GOP47_0020546 [Adiantum capillus-veneris]|uniref:Uncharacterized protein n=1 Tax=Adiantum capillus-veneris TaxID=13818 RepID=A0A9D4U9C2_ADICA|nr:hypothetical protein GOP47_0020546 [Adiantum capillus-veneris]